jgi:abortive infection Abi-like protein
MGFDEEATVHQSVERLKDVLMERAQGRFADPDEYVRLRGHVLANATVRAHLPSFLMKCRSLTDFWDYLKPLYATYAERRQFLREQFEPALLAAQGQPRTPSDAEIALRLTADGSSYIHEQWAKALERRGTDPEGAITSARTLLESVCKFILDQAGESYTVKEDLGDLYKKVAARLRLEPSQHSEQVFRQILGGCNGIVSGLASLRNRLSDAHGQGATQVRPAPRHAELAVNLAGAMSAFLLASWSEGPREKKDSRL